MAKSTKRADGKRSERALVIVESPAKARTIGKFLGRNFTVEASIGHIRDLPAGKKEMPESLKSESWARLGVNVDDEFNPVYVVPSEKKKQVSKLKKLLGDASALYLATDEDREGEAISWHLREVLQPKVPVRRLVFHEITRAAIQQSLEQPREIDMGLVRAQETRRILDRLYGYEVSEFLWKKSLGRSAGRVQSVAVRLIVDREWERMAFVSATWWDLVGLFLTDKQESLRAELVSVDGRRIPEGKDFDPKTGQLKNPQLLLLDEAGARSLAQKLIESEFTVTNVEVKPYSRSPWAPFTTSTLQQEANRKLGFTARRTMRAAQSLYENGHITYMRTDSTTLSSEAIEAARELVRSEYGPAFLPDAPRIYTNKVKNAQEAHEAIRPAGTPFQFPNELRGKLSDDEYRLFELIWKRTVASQMANARGNNITITVEGGGAVFTVSGKTIEFAGFLRAYVEGSDDPAAELADQEVVLPPVAKGQRVTCMGLDVKSRSTQPPARYSEASLTRELERLGIGRPSTFASIIDTIQDRKYVLKRSNYLVPTWSAFAVIRLFEEHFQSLVDYEFTAQMEDLLDAISRGESDHLDYLRRFYFGDPSSRTGESAIGLRPQLDAKIKEVDARSICTFVLPRSAEHVNDEPVAVRVGRFGAYVERGKLRASIPEDWAPDELNYDKAIELLAHSSVAEEPLGFCPETKRPVFLKQGRFGPYVQLGAVEEGEKPKNASLLKNMQPSDVTLDVALQLLALPRLVGIHPEDQQPIQAFNGKFGPYVKWGEESRSLPRELSLFTVNLEQAIELFRQPKSARGRGPAARPAAIREFSSSPVTGQTMKLLNGRYGPYLTDGETNVTLPKDAVVESLTDELVAGLLAEKAALKPARKRGRTGGSKKKSAVQSANVKKKKPPSTRRRTKHQDHSSE